MHLHIRTYFLQLEEEREDKGGRVGRIETDGRHRGREGGEGRDREDNTPL